MNGKVKIEALDENGLQQFCKSFTKSIENIKTTSSFTIGYFDSTLNILSNEECPGPTEFCIALLTEILSNMKPGHELWDKIKYAVFILNLATRNYDFAVLYDIYHQVEIDVLNGDLEWGDQNLFEKRISEKLVNGTDPLMDPLETVKCAIENDDAEIDDESKDDLKLKLGLLFPLDPLEELDETVTKTETVIKRPRKRKKKTKLDDGEEKPKKRGRPKKREKDGESDKAKPKRVGKANFIPNHELKGKTWKFCTDCDFRTKTVIAMERHCFEKHEQNRLCTQCGYLHTSYDDLLQHMKSHTASCPICRTPVLMNNRLSLERHMQTHRPTNDNVPKVACEICGDLVSKYTLKSHLIRKHSERTHECDLCEYVAKDKLVLKQHRERHFLTKVECPECGKQVKNVRSHLSKTCPYINRKKHVCDICDKTFAYLHGLKRHNKSIHQKIKNARCEYCNYETYSTYNMRQHIAQVHTKEWKEFFQNCEVCGQKTGSMEYHMKTYHYTQYLQQYKFTDATKTEEETENVHADTQNSAGAGFQQT